MYLHFSIFAVNFCLCAWLIVSCLVYAHKYTADRKSPVRQETHYTTTIADEDTLNTKQRHGCMPMSNLE